MDWVQLLQEKASLQEAVVRQIEAAINEGASPEKVLLDAGVSPAVLREVLAAYFSVESGEIDDKHLPPDELYRYIPEESATYYQIVPYAEEDGVLKIATSNPDNLQMRQAVQFLSNNINLPFEFVFVPSSEIEIGLKAYASLSGEVDEALETLEEQLQNEIEEKGKASAEGNEQAEVEHLKEDAPVTKIVATTLRYAVDGKASDIHIEPEVDKVVVRFRVDGVLQKSLELPQKVHSALIARVKILSSMRLDEKRKPQDGRFSANFDGRKIDFRVSVLPTNHGEKVVIRTLEDTGVNAYHMEAIRRAVRQPFGIILISGPTGSGKSTTLYAMLSEVDRMTKNVLSLEDPIEYDINNVSQSQMRPEIGYTFAAGLRSALRQDPDIIMVGEIRDKETAQLAIQAALTGHLVLSTIHTNNSIGVVARLIDMGVDPYLIAPTLKVAIAQRLARRLFRPVPQ
jgi:type IV pilus assembly protein PilB